MSRNLVLLVTLSLLTVACAAKGPAFEPVEPSAGKALVYIYRPDKFIGGAVRYHVAIGPEWIVFLVKGGYFPYLAEPGETEFWARTEARAEVSEHLAAGKTYYLRGGIKAGAFVGRPKLEFFDPEVGREEIQECVLLPPAERRSALDTLLADAF